MYASLPKAPASTQPRAAAGARVLERLALPQLLLDDGVGVEERREAVALADDAQGVLQQASGVLRESCRFLLGCSRCISSMTSSSRCETSFEPSRPSAAARRG